MLLVYFIPIKQSLKEVCRTNRLVGCLICVTKFMEQTVSKGRDRLFKVDLHGPSL